MNWSRMRTQRPENKLKKKKKSFYVEFKKNKYYLKKNQ